MEKSRLGTTALASGVLAFAPTFLWAQQQSDPYRYGYGPHMMGWGGGWYGMIFGPIFMILVLILVVAAVVLLFRWLGGSVQAGPFSNDVPRDRTALEILKERFARGEIDKEEFDERRRVLNE